MGVYRNLAKEKADAVLPELVEELIEIAKDRQQMVNDRLGAIHMLLMISSEDDEG